MSSPFTRLLAGLLVTSALGCGDRSWLGVDTRAEATRDGGAPVGSPMIDAGGVQGSPDAAALEPFAVGFFGTCFLQPDGTVGCFVYPSGGDGTPMNVTLTAIPGVAGATQIAGHDPFCARLGDGTVTCWSMVNGNGDAGIFAAKPVQGLDHVTQVDVSGSFGCAAREDGSAWCWGDDTYNNLGLGDLCPTNNEDCDNTTHTPAPVVDVGGVADVTVSDINACARTAPGDVSCWGRVGVGDTATLPDDRGTPIAIPAASGALSLDMSEGSTIATLPDAFVVFGHPLGIEAPDAPTPVRQPRAPGEAVFGNRYNTFCHKQTSLPLHCVGGMSLDGQATNPGEFDVPGSEAAIGVGLATFTGCVRLTASDLLCWGQYFDALTRVHVQ